MKKCIIINHCSAFQLSWCRYAFCDPQYLDTEGRFRGNSAICCRGLFHREQGLYRNGLEWFIIVQVTSGSMTLLSDTWTQKADFGGTARALAVGFSIGSKGYIGTGYDGSYSDTSDFWEYDPTANTWTQKADFGGTARDLAVGFSIGSKGYIGTGQAIIQATIQQTSGSMTLLANTWTQKADFGGTARDGAVGFSIGSKGYIGTGYNYGSFQIQKTSGSTTLLANTWTQKADFGGQREMVPSASPSGARAT